ncbi:MAG: DinB family protein [Bacteroidales bacterium]|nr:DinB family protein [Bacteroidales bacterium]
MIKEFEPIAEGVLSLIKIWESKLLGLPNDVITQRRNSQNRTIKQIVGHMIDSASNNTHRIVHMHYQPSPLRFPNYATNGNNDRWIAIQNYQEETWADMVYLWKYSNIHIVHVFKNVDPSKLENKWHYNEEKLISLKDCIIDYLGHFKLHLGEIDELIHKEN